METGIVKTQENLNESQQGKRKKEQIQSLEEDELKYVNLIFRKKLFILFLFF